MGQDEEEADRIHMTDEWASLLEKYPTKPAKKGRMMYLLKLKSKKTPTMKPRKAYTPLDIIGQLNESKPMTQTLLTRRASTSPWPQGTATTFLRSTRRPSSSPSSSRSTQKAKRNELFTVKLITLTFNYT